MNKTIWIADAAYLMKAAPGRVDYLRLKQHLETLNGGAIYESYYLNSMPYPTNEAQDGFHNWLKLAPPTGPKMRVQLYKLKSLACECPKCHTKFQRQVQKGVDVGIATLILKLATQNQYDRLILSAGDGDFEDAIDYVKSELHKEIWIAGFDNSVSADLQSYADLMVWLSADWEAIRRPEAAGASDGS
jgi:uncharacterized LabA/DUF88 family protein